MKWNHRIVKKFEGGEWTYHICEVYYNRVDRPVSCGDPFTFSEDLQGVVQLLNWMQGALKKPVLEFRMGRKHARLIETTEVLPAHPLEAVTMWGCEDEHGFLQMKGGEFDARSYADTMMERYPQRVLSVQYYPSDVAVADNGEIVRIRDLTKDMIGDL